MVPYFLSVCLHNVCVCVLVRSPRFSLFFCHDASWISVNNGRLFKTMPAGLFFLGVLCQEEGVGAQKDDPCPFLILSHGVGLQCPTIAAREPGVGTFQQPGVGKHK